jgi:NTE family protein
MNYDSFDNKYSQKRMVFSETYSLFTFFRLYKYIQSVFYCKTDFGFAATILITPLKVQTEAGFSFGNDSVSFFNFVLGGYGYNQINNFRFYGYDF